jgi:RNA ligase (TIGR02306 family)
MPSELNVPLVQIETIRPIPEADRIEVVELFKGQIQTVCQKGQFAPGDKAIYLPVDCLLPAELIEQYRITDYLAGPDKNRVRCIRLKKADSFGLLVKDDDLTAKYRVGKNMAEILQIKKYEPPVRKSNEFVKKPKTLKERIKFWFRCEGRKFHENKQFKIYTDIRNGRHYEDIFEHDERVVITEKIHGTNARYGKLDGEICIGSHNVQKPLNMPEAGSLVLCFKQAVCKLMKWNRAKRYLNESTWHRVYEEGYIQDFLRMNDNLILFGEIYGPSVQKLAYGIKPNQTPGFKAFDIFNVKENRFLDFPDFESLCKIYHIPTVPVLFVGKFESADVLQLAEGQSTFADNIREGIVVKTLEEKTHPEIGRKTLKYISNAYLLNRKDGDDVTVI